MSAGSPHPATGTIIVRAPPPRSPGFLSIEQLDTRPPKVGDTLNLNLRAMSLVGSFSHFYYMVRTSWVAEEDGVQGASGQERAPG